MAKDFDRRQAQMRMLFETLSGLEDFSRLYDAYKYRRPSAYADACGVSLTAACYVFDTLEKRGLIERIGRKDIELTEAGDELLRVWGEVALEEIERLLKLSDEKLEEAWRNGGSLRALLSKVARGEEISVREAVKLEDDGHVKRLPGRKVEMTEKGLSFLRRGSRGPLPGRGNTTTMVVLPK